MYLLARDVMSDGFKGFLSFGEDGDSPIEVNVEKAKNSLEKSVESLLYDREAVLDDYASQLREKVLPNIHTSESAWLIDDIQEVLDSLEKFKQGNCSIGKSEDIFLDFINDYGESSLEYFGFERGNESIIDKYNRQESFLNILTNIEDKGIDIFIIQEPNNGWGNSLNLEEFKEDILENNDLHSICRDYMSQGNNGMLSFGEKGNSPIEISVNEVIKDVAKYMEDELNEIDYIKISDKLDIDKEVEMGAISENLADLLKLFTALKKAQDENISIFIIKEANFVK